MPDDLADSNFGLHSLIFRPALKPFPGLLGLGLAFVRARVRYLGLELGLNISGLDLVLLDCG